MFSVVIVTVNQVELDGSSSSLASSLYREWISSPNSQECVFASRTGGSHVLCTGGDDYCNHRVLKKVFSSRIINYHKKKSGI